MLTGGNEKLGLCGWPHQKRCTCPRATLPLRIRVAHRYRRIPTCLCHTARAGSRGGPAVLQTYWLLCGLLLNHMLRRNGILVMVKHEEKHVGFPFPCGRRRRRGTGTLAPTLLVCGTRGMWQVALWEGLVIVAVSSPGTPPCSPDDLHTDGGFGRGLRGLQKSVAGASSSYCKPAFSFSAGRGILLSCYASSRAVQTALSP